MAFFSKSFSERLKKTNKDVEIAGSGVNNVFPSRRKIPSPASAPKLLKGFAISLYRKGRGWTPDKGSEENEHIRIKLGLPALVAGGGQHAGEARVEWVQRYLLIFHEWFRDFFHSSLSTSFPVVVLAICVVYIGTFYLFGVTWWAELRKDDICVQNSNGYTDFIAGQIMAVITQQTIGYGNTYPNECWESAWLLMAHQVLGMIVNAITVGIIFSRVSYPQNRGRTIAISDHAIIARRDGTLKFMFRIADIRQAQVIAPRVKAYLYTWGEARYTIEGDRVPAKIEDLDIGYIDGMLLLPLVEEHTIDERSPLSGHTHESLMAVNAEIIVTFEGVTEFGNDFMSRQSYLPHELRWGHCFRNMLSHPEPGGSQYRIDFSGFHEVVPQTGFEELSQSQACHQVIHSSPDAVPYPLLLENTFVISSNMVLNHGNNKKYPQVQFRVGDTYPNQHVAITVRVLLYRWLNRDANGVPQDYIVAPLDVGFRTRGDRLLLWLPMTITHTIDESSPLAPWMDSTDAVVRDDDSTIVVVLEGYKYAGDDQKKDLKLCFFHTNSNIKANHVFQPVVACPTLQDRKPRVDWTKFHSILPVPQEDKNHSGHLHSLMQVWRQSSLPSGSASSFAQQSEYSLPHGWRPGSFATAKAFPSDDNDSARYRRSWLPFLDSKQQRDDSAKRP